MRRLYLLRMVFILAMMVALAGAARAVVYVKADSAGAQDGDSWGTAYHTIGEAVADAGASGEAVWVARGTYTEKITASVPVAVYGGFAGTESDLRQRDWVANATIVKAGGNGSAFTVSANVRIDGFTIKNGDYGVFCESCSPTITNNTIQGCAYYGIYCFGGSPSITGSSITNNGFGIGCEESSAIISGNAITGNSEYAIYCLSGSPAITANKLQSNYGGVYASAGAVGVERNNVQLNLTCGVYCCEGVTASIGSNLFVGNDDGVRTDAVNASVVNNTIVSSERYGIYWHDGAPSIANNIVAFSPTGLFKFGGTETLTSNDVYQNVMQYGELINHPADISADPLFVDRAAGDYHLTLTSPCRDAGTQMGISVPALDFDAQARLQGLGVDIGADELGATKISAARQWGLNMPAGLENVVVTAWFGDYFYVESEDRTSGIRVVKPGEPPHVGWRSNVSGTVKLNPDGELYVEASRIDPISPGAIAPIAIGNRDLGGGEFGYQDSVWSWQWNWHSDAGSWKYEWTRSLHLNNIGLLVTVCGTVTNVGDGYLYIDDGSAVDDGTLTGTDRNIGIKVICDSSTYAAGHRLMVTGISSCFRTPSGLARRILVPTPSDIHSM